MLCVPPHPRANAASPVNVALLVHKGCKVLVGSLAHRAPTDPRWVTRRDRAWWLGATGGAVRLVVCPWGAWHPNNCTFGLL